MSHNSEFTEQLLAQHRSLEASLEDILGLVAEGGRGPVQAAWTTFESGLFRHMDFEEQELFPIVEALHPEEVQRLRAEHARIREVIGELGLCCDLHTLREDALERIGTLIRSHAARENETLYRWIGESTSPGSRGHILSALRGLFSHAEGSLPKQAPLGRFG